MSADRVIVTAAFHSWMNGTGFITSIFAEDMTWEIIGGSAVSGNYACTQQLADELLRPFGARFTADAPFRPVSIRAIYNDKDKNNGTVIVVWDGQGTTTAGTKIRPAKHS